jgi:type II secretory pathway pseudopilin PulG
MILVVAIIGIMATIGIPNLIRVVHRAKIEGIARETSVLMQRARSEAVKQNVSAVVRFDFTNNEVIAFADVDGPTVVDPPDSIFNPVAGQPHRATDYELGRYQLPNRVGFLAPTADADGPVKDFTPIGAEFGAIFDPNGSIRDTGAIRFGDQRGNFLEIRVTPAATARVQMRKWDPDLNDWQVRNQNDKPWVWL